MMQLEAHSQRIYSKENSKDDQLKENSFCNCIFSHSILSFSGFYGNYDYFFFPHQNKLFQFKPHADSGQLNG